MRLVLTIGGSVFSFTPLNDNGPYPFLISAGTVSIAARAGRASTFGSTDAPSSSAKLQNQFSRVAKLIGNPLRARAELYDGDDLAFVGFVAAISYGAVIELRLQS